MTISYADLVAGKDLSAEIDQAYNYDGVGLLTVSGVPNLLPLREHLLKIGFRWAQLPDATKNKYEHAASFYSFGWSQGKEILEEAEASKGSFYNNPTYERPTEDPALIKAYPSYCSPNIWPDADMPELKPAFQDLGRLIVDVGALVATQCDRFVSAQLPSYAPNTLADIVCAATPTPPPLKTLNNPRPDQVRGSRVHKGRLLHYYPPRELLKPQEGTSSSWCGWHNDHGALTGLTSAMFVNERGEEVPNPDPRSGLHVKTRYTAKHNLAT